MMMIGAIGRNFTGHRHHTDQARSNPLNIGAAVNPGWTFLATRVKV
jgi:hypothetical protein